MKLNDFRSPVYLVLSCALLLALGAVMSLDVGINFSIASGFYDEPVSLEITSPIKGAKIFYTTDGSVPDETDTLYSGAIILTDVLLAADVVGVGRCLQMPDILVIFSNSAVRGEEARFCNIYQRHSGPVLPIFVGIQQVIFHLNVFL